LAKKIRKQGIKIRHTRLSCGCIKLVFHESVEAQGQSFQPEIVSG
jgi:hypothetical protein